MSTTGALRRRLRSRLLDGMIRQVGAAGSWKVLVVDREALRILAAALGGLNDLVDEGVTIIEMLDMRREPLPRIPAIFFCAPSPESIQHLVAEAPRQYKEFHLFFTHRVPDFQMDELKRGNAAMLRRVKNFKELNVELLATESRVFSLDRPGASIPQLFGGASRDALDEMTVISERLTDACGLVGREIDWAVRADGSSSRARTVASLVKEQLGTIQLQARTDRASREAEGKDPVAEESWAEDEGVKPTKATLLVLDRASDLMSPLMHEFTYQAMAHDLLPLEYTKPGGVFYDLPQDDDPEKVKSLLWDDEATDTTWVGTRHMFVEDAKVDAQERFKTFLQTDAAYKIRGREGADVGINEMSAAVRSLPESQKRADKHSLHIVALNECLKRCTAIHLPQLAIAEQDIAIGRHPDTSRAKPDVVIETLTELVHDVKVPLQHRIRLLMLAIAVAEGTVALGGESSLLALTSSFKLRLGRSSAADVSDLSPVMASAVRGFQTILTKAIEASDAFAVKHGRGPARDAGGEGGNQATQFADNLKAKYAHQRDVKLKEKEIERARRRRAGRAADDELPLDVQRYLPPLTSVALDLVDEKLSEELFPLTGAVSVDSIISNLGAACLGGGNEDPVAKRRPRRTGGKSVLDAVGSSGAKFMRGQAGNNSQDQEEDDRYMVADEEHLFVVFFVGGVTYSEIRSVYDVCKRRNANILIGGSQVLTPAAFLDACAAVSDPIVRMKVMLPPLPIELAQSRAARDRTLKEGAEKKAAAEKKSALAKGPSGGSAAETSPTAVERDGDAADPDGPEVVVVSGYKKKKLFGRRKK